MNFKKISHEILTVARFGLVGVTATIIHMLVAAALITQVKIHPFLANTIAFSVAFFISFFGHYFWSFQSKAQSTNKAIKRFFLIAAGGFGFNTLVLATLLKSGITTPLLSTMIAIAVVPFMTFIASRFWAFKK